MEAPATASWDQSINDADFSKLKAGFEALDMNHRWEIRADDPDENGVISIHISRSWTEIDQYILDIKPSGERGGKITSITWESGFDSTSFSFKLLPLTNLIYLGLVDQEKW
jgi:hypothetical protein